MAISTKLVVANFGIFFTVLVTVFTLTSANNDKKVKVIPLDVKPGQGKFENGVVSQNLSLTMLLCSLFGQ